MEPEKIPSDVKSAYRMEFQQGVKLFQNSLKEYESAGDFAKKKEMLKDVMDKALDVVNQSAKGFLSQNEAKIQRDRLVADYNDFIKNDNPDSFKKLNQDLERLKKIA